MARVFITGSADGLGLMAARLLIKQGHNVILHARHEQRAKETQTNLPQAEAIVTGDLSSIAQTVQLAEKLNVQDAIPILKQNLQEEEVMATWLMANVSTMLNRLWPYIESSSGNRTTTTNSV